MDLTWRIPGKSLNLPKLSEAGTTTAKAYEGISVEIEKEDTDCVSFFFTLSDADGASSEVEISIYDLGGDGLVLSLEADAADNNQVWEDACQIAEDLSDQLGGSPLTV